MILVNFAHPLTTEQQGQIEQLTGQPIKNIVTLNSQVDVTRSLTTQVTALIEQITLSAKEWQTEPILINPPSLNYITAVLLTQLYGRMGYFPAIIRMRPVIDTLVPSFAVAEIINLQQVRDHTRERCR